jgi:6-phosphogluconolactonase
VAASTILRVADPEAMTSAAAAELARRGTAAVAERGSFTLVLAGGSTPRMLYRHLAGMTEPSRARVPWDRTHLFFGDERHVPPDDPDSNYRMAEEALIAHVSAASVHRMRGEEPAAAVAAAAYEAELRAFFHLRGADEPPPRFDLVLLGLGSDGHTASLFPGSAALDERRRWVVAPFVERLGAHRITLTLPALNRARAVLFLVSGAQKAEALARVLAPAAGELPPAARVQPEGGELLWIVDRDAAARAAGLTADAT